MRFAGRDADVKARVVRATTQSRYKARAAANRCPAEIVFTM
jgi:hypothetical protein